MKYWLIKSEGDCYSIDDLRKDKTTPWTGVRNFQARNYMRDGMSIGDLVLFYHSNSRPNGIYGLARVNSRVHNDDSSFDVNDEHYDPRMSGKDYLWQCVDIAFVERFSRPVTLDEIKRHKVLKNMEVAKIGQRLSIMPVEKEHYKLVLKLLRN
jgi:predicted RNA-binding protein with PUA-like domain